MKNRYYFFKSLFPKYVILFKKKGKYVTMGYDKMLMPLLKEKNISYIVVNNYNKVKVYDKHPNRYDESLIRLFLKEELIKIIKQ